MKGQGRSALSAMIDRWQGRVHSHAPSTSVTADARTDAIPVVSIRGVSKTFKSSHGAVRALDGLSLDVAPGEFVVLLGPSGCGKSTLLRSIAGLETPDDGDIVIMGRPVFSGARKLSLAPEARGTSMVFQSYALWPHMSIYDNVAYPLRTQKIPERDSRPRVEAALSTVGCAHLSRRYPHQISGGQQQRASLARAIIAHRGLILFDEPLSNVDAKVRERLRLELLALQQELGFAAVYVTHDQTEAMVIATRIAVMDSGRIVQLGTPTEIYNEPTTHYVADFIGAANFLKGTVAEARAEEVFVRTDVGVARALRRGSTYRTGDRVEIFFRPEHLRIESAGTEGPNSWRASLQASLYLGPNYEYVLRAADSTLLAWTPRPLDVADSREVWLTVRDESIRLLADPEAVPERPGSA